MAPQPRMPEVTVASNDANCSNVPSVRVSFRRGLLEEERRFVAGLQDPSPVQNESVVATEAKVRAENTELQQKVAELEAKLKKVTASADSVTPAGWVGNKHGI